MENGISCLSVLSFLFLSTAAFDMSTIPTKKRTDLVQSHVKILCDSSNLMITKLEWRCKGCFSISPTKETRIAVLENDATLTLIYPNRFSISKERNGFGLSVQPSLTEDSGVYFCLVNGRREPFSAVQVAIQDVPSTPGKPLIMKFDSNWVELSWSPPLHHHHSIITHYLIHVLEGEETDWASHQIIQTESADTTFTVSDLKPFTVYSFKVTAVNKIGLSNQSLPSYHMMTLREVPSGKPTITAAHNLSSSSIKISWRAPNVSTINGEFLGYQLSWKDRSSKDSADIRSVQIKDPTETKHKISGLQTYTQYLVSIQVINPKGLGPSSTVVVMTDEGVPSSPQNITEILVSNNSVTLHWMEPEHPNGIISGYRLYFMTKKMTDVITVKDSSKEIVYMLDKLAPYKKYSIWVKAFTSKHEGNSSDTIEVVTDVSGPGRPIITNLTCPGDNSLYVEWSQPEKFYHSVDSYTIFYRGRHEKGWQQRSVLVPPVVKQHVEKMLLTNLTTNQEYTLYIQALTSSLYKEDLTYPGKMSETHTLVISENCDGIIVSPMREEEPQDNAMVSLAIVVGASAVFLILLVAVMSLALWRRRKMKNHFYIPSSQSQRDDMPLWDLESLDNESHKTPISTNFFVQHVDLLHADGEIGFKKEFDYIMMTTNGGHSIKGNGSDGNQLCLVDGFQNKKAFIVTNFPSETDNERNKFWVFISEQAIETVVFMDIPPFEELLPQETQCFGAVSVIPFSMNNHSGFTLQIFKISKKKMSKKSEEHFVSIYHYIPSKLRVKERLEFLRFVKHSFNSNKSGGQILLSSTSNALSYITISTMLQQSQYKNELNILTYICHIINQTRLHNLTLVQYIFIHDVLTEAVIAGNTSVVKNAMTSYVRSLESSETDDSGGATYPCWKSLEKQFSVSTEIHPSSHQYLTAVNPSNHMMNNSMDYVAVDMTRVVLHPMVGGTDYVNSSWVPGYNGDHQYIVSQHPSNSSLGQFWHSVWQTNTSVIICLSVFQQPFWPTFGNSLLLQGLKLSLENETSVSGYQSVSLELELGDSHQTVQLVFCPNWPHLSVPVSNCVHLIDCIARISHSDKPTMVIDSFGATEASIFCVLSNLVRTMDLEDHVDVFYWFKSVHLSRPGVWVSPDNLLFLYRVMSELCSIKKNGGGGGGGVTNNLMMGTQPIFTNIEVNI